MPKQPSYQLTNSPTMIKKKYMPQPPSEKRKSIRSSMNRSKKRIGPTNTSQQQQQQQQGRSLEISSTTRKNSKSLHGQHEQQGLHPRSLHGHHEQGLHGQHEQQGLHPRSLHGSRKKSKRNYSLQQSGNAYSKHFSSSGGGGESPEDQIVDSMHTSYEDLLHQYNNIVDATDKVPSIRPHSTGTVKFGASRRRIGSLPMIQKAHSDIIGWNNLSDIDHEINADQVELMQTMRSKDQDVDKELFSFNQQLGELSNSIAMNMEFSEDSALSKSKLSQQLFEIHERAAKTVEKQVEDICLQYQQQQLMIQKDNFEQFKKEMEIRDRELMQKTKLTIQNMRSMMDSLKKQKEDLVKGFVKQKKEYIDEIKSLEAQIRSQHTTIRQLEIEKQKMAKNQNVDFYQHQITRLEKEITKMQSEKETLEDTIQQTEEEKARLVRDIEFKDEEIKKAKIEIDTIKSNESGAYQNLKLAEQKLKILQEQNEELHRSLAGTQEDAMKTLSEKRRSQNELNERISEITEMRTKQETLQMKIKHLLEVEESYNTLKGELVHQKHLVKDREMEVEKIKKKLAETEATHQEKFNFNQNKMKTLWSRYKKLKQEKKQIEEKYNETVSEKEKIYQEGKHKQLILTSERDTSNQMLENAEYKLKKQREQIDDLEQMNQTLRHRLKEQSEHLESSSKMSQENATLQDRYQEAKGKLTELESRNSHLEKIQAVHDQELKNKDNEIAHLKELILSKEEEFDKLEKEKKEQFEKMEAHEVKLKMLKFSKENEEENLSAMKRQLKNMTKEKELTLELVQNLEQKVERQREMLNNLQSQKDKDPSLDVVQIQDENKIMKRSQKELLTMVDKLKGENAKLLKQATNYRNIIQSLRLQYSIHGS